MTQKIKTSAKIEGKTFNTLVIVSGILTVVGLSLWVMQYINGLSVTGMRDLNSWGLYITMFMFLVGLSAGGLIISSVPKALGIKGFKEISKVAVWTSVCSTVLAVAFVLIDLGHPTRVWELFAYSNLGSPLMWDILVISFYLMLSIVYLWAMIKSEQGQISSIGMRVVSVMALCVAIMVHSVTAWIFGLQAGREIWHTAILAPWFVSSALVCGTALVIIVVSILRKSGYVKADDIQINNLSKLLGIFILVDLYFYFCDILTTGFPTGAGLGIFAKFVEGPLAGFYSLQVITCTIAAAICFAPKLRKGAWIIAASICAIVGIFCKRVALLVGGFQHPNIEFAANFTGNASLNASVGYHNIYDTMVYFPTSTEFGIALGVMSFGVLLFLLGLKYLPLSSE